MKEIQRADMHQILADGLERQQKMELLVAAMTPEQKEQHLRKEQEDAEERELILKQLRGIGFGEFKL